MAKTFTFPVRVYVEDTDSTGVVYHANYIKYMERSRTEWLETLNLGIDMLAEEGVFFVVRNLAVDYLKPALLNDSLEVSVSVEEIRRSTIRFRHQIISTKRPGKPLCEATVFLVCVNKAYRPQRVPEKIKEALL